MSIWNIGDDVACIQGENCQIQIFLYVETLVCSGVLPYIEEQYCLTEYHKKNRFCNAVKSQRKIGKKEERYIIVELTEQTNLCAFFIK